MKYDLTKNQTISAKRTLNSLVNAMFNLLKTKSFESITVQELCTLSLIPRATFYNYFEDKYDLLNYCWFTLRLKLDSSNSNNDNVNNDSLELLKLFLAKCIDYLDSNIESVNLILKHNDISHYLINSFALYLTNVILVQISSSPSKFNVPNEIEAKHSAHTVLTLLEWKYIIKNDCSKENLIQYLVNLLKT